MRKALSLLGESLLVTSKNGDSVLETLRQSFFSPTNAVSLPNENEPDLFEPFFTPLQEISRVAIAEDDKLITYMSIPDFSDQIDMVDEITISIPMFYKTRGQYDLAMKYWQRIAEYQRGLETFAAKIGKEEDLRIESARVLISIGDILWLQGKLQEAKEFFRHAGRELDITKDLFEKKILLAEVSHKGWKTESHFAEVYASKNEG